MSLSLRDNHPTAGFSLVEMLVAVTIIGIAIAITLPKINRITTQSKVQRGIQALQLEVEQAFAIAARNRAPVAIRWNSPTMQLQVTNLAGNTVYRRAGLGTGAGYGFSSSEVSVSRSTLVVFPNGHAEDTLAITLSRNGFSKMMRVSKSGMVRLK